MTRRHNHDRRLLLTAPPPTARYALIRPGPLASEVRGSIGGVVFARNRGGAYVRNRTAPLNPSSADQNRIRQILADLAQRWSGTLTESQREEWRTYAENVPLQNALGESRNVSGINMYARGNSLILDTAGTRVDDGPTNFTVGPSFTPGITLDPAADTLTIDDLGTYTPTTDGTIGFLIQQAPPDNSGVFFKGSGFRKISGTQIADEATDLPADVPLAFPIEAGQSVFVRTIAVTPDGRVGSPIVQRFLA